MYIQIKDDKCLDCKKNTDYEDCAKCLELKNPNLVELIFDVQYRFYMRGEKYSKKEIKDKLKIQYNNKWISIQEYDKVVK